MQKQYSAKYFIKKYTDRFLARMDSIWSFQSPLQIRIRKGRQQGSVSFRWCILQADNRPLNLPQMSKSLEYDACQDSSEMMRFLNGGSLAQKRDYWTTSSLINQMKCSAMHCEYAQILIEPRHYRDRHVTWGKIRILLDFMQKNPEINIVAFLDSDAFVRDESRFKSLVEILANSPEKHGIFSRDPLMPENTYINTGCMILKNDDFTRNFMETVWNDVHRNPRYRLEWPHEQHSASAFVKENKNAFFVCKTSVLNTPCGEIVRHTWWKELFEEIAMDEVLATMARSLCHEHDQSSPNPTFDIGPLLDD